MSTLTSLIQGRDVLMTEKQVGELMADIAALAQGMVRIVVHDHRTETTRHSHRGKTTLLARREGGVIASQRGHPDDLNVEEVANGKWINWVDR